MSLPAVHSIYGHAVASNVPIAGLPQLPLATRADIRVELGPDQTLVKMGSGSRRLWFESSVRDDSGDAALRIWEIGESDSFHFRYSDGVSFWVAGSGRSISGSWPAGSGPEDTLTSLMGPVLGFALRLRGFVCLHASAVAVDDHAVAFAGPPGAGKSTTAAIMATAGFPVVTDDVLVLRQAAGGTMEAQPGPARILLWPDSVECLFGSERALPILDPVWGKRYLDAARQESLFQKRPLTLGAVYLLGERADESREPRIEAMPPAEALLALIGNIYAHQNFDPRMRARELNLLGPMVTRLPVKTIVPSSELAVGRKLPDLVLRDFRGRT